MKRESFKHQRIFFSAFTWEATSSLPDLVDLLYHQMSRDTSIIISRATATLRGVMVIPAPECGRIRLRLPTFYRSELLKKGRGLFTVSSRMLHHKDYRLWLAIMLMKAS